MSLPLVYADALDATAVSRALRESGGFMLQTDFVPGLCAEALAAAHAFFALPAEFKAALAIEHSPHFRGWSEMHNARDWRQQIHLGRDCPARGETPAYLRLEGPNLWPADPHWKSVIVDYMNAVAAVGEAILHCAAADLQLFSDPFSDPFAGVARDGYLLLKLIGYHPQPGGDAHRSGVAAHVDFSWITLTLQDSAGLEICRPDGEWVQVPPRDGVLWVHAGELLQLASGGAYQATPHRVINPSLSRTRVSLPLFLNPPLGALVTPSVCTIAPVPEAVDVPHVHRVFPADAEVGAFVFGEAEWRRKGLNGWCHLCAPPRA